MSSYTRVLMGVPWWDTEYLGCDSFKKLRIKKTTGNIGNI